MCVWFPQWPLQETLARQPDWKEHPVVLYTAGGRGGQTVVARSRKAAAQGVRPGMPLAQAKAFLEKATPLAQYERSDPVTQRAALQELAEWCVQFSPVVGIEEAEAPESLFLDSAGCDHLFGGESAMAERVVEACTERGLVARVAIADTAGAAWAAAHYSAQAATVLPPGYQELALQPLPIEALRLPSAAVSKLRALDIRTIAQLQALPRESLPSRFGLEILRRLDQALGGRPEPVRPIAPLPPVEAGQSFLYPTTDRWILEVTIRTLLEELLATTGQKNQGVQELLCRLVGERREETALTIRLLQPTLSAARLLELIRLRLDATRLSGDVGAVYLKAEVIPVEVDHYSLFEGVDLLDRHGELLRLIERLSSRLGPRAVTRPEWSLNPQPELAIAYTSALGEKSDTKVRSPSTKRSSRREKSPVPQPAHGKEAFQSAARNPIRGLYQPPNPPPASTVSAALVAPFRPARLVRQPVAIDVTSLIPDGPPIRFFWNGGNHRVERCWGPERIETGWWLGRHTRRDYYRVETNAGLRFWLVRQIEDGRWFLHGVFA
jgi:protein ImuB